MANNPKPSPNLLFILCDQMRFDALSAYRPWLQTPALDQLAHEGQRFDHVYCSAQACVPARACLFTGRYQELHRCMGNAQLLAPPERTWAQALDEAGYQTLAVGRTHHMDRGFETVRVPYGNSYPMIDYDKVHEVPWGEDGVLATSPEPLEKFYETRVASTACDLMTDMARNEPFAMYVGFIAPHPPLVAPEPFASMYDPAEMPWDSSQTPESHWRDVYERQVSPSFHETKQRQAMAAYFGLVSLVDHAVGLLLKQLDELHLSDHTLVIFTSDHGEQLGHRGLWNKGFAYDPSIRVPFLMRWPGQIPSGPVIDAMIEHVDVGPTILEAMGVSAMAHRSGRSFWPVVTGEKQAHRDWIYSSMCAGHASIYRDRHWKFLDQAKEQGDSWVELYDLQADPNEQHNLAAAPDQQARIQAFRNQLWRHQRTRLVESSLGLYPDQVQPPTFNAQFKKS